MFDLHILMIFLDIYMCIYYLIINKMSKSMINNLIIYAGCAIVSSVSFVAVDNGS